MSLQVHYLNDDQPPISEREQLIAALEAAKSNGGDGRCLCSGCLAYWALKLLMPEEKK